MTKVEKSKSKTLYKIEIVLLKVLPMVMAGLCLLNTILSYYGIETELITYLGGVGIIPLLFLYISSYVFKFCSYHRMFLHYVVVNNVLCYIDYKYGIPITDRDFLCIHLCIAGLFLFIIIHLKLNLCMKK